MSSDTPQSIVISATTAFDGSTAFTGSWQPASDPAEPRIAASRTTVGRFSFKALLGSGNFGSIILARCLDPGVAVVMSKRSASSAEIGGLLKPDDPAPVVSNSLLQSVTLSTSWSTPVVFGPTDAMALTSGGANTVELLRFDLSGSMSTALIQSLLVAAATNASVQIVTTDTVLSAWTGDHFVLFSPATPNVVVTLPLASTMTAPARLHIARKGGSWGRLAADAANTINGLSTPIILADYKETIVELMSGEWLATDVPATSDLTVTNGVAGATASLPVIFGTRIIEISFTAYGNLQLPLASAVPIGATYVLVRSGDSAATPPVPARCKLVVGDAGDDMDAIADDVRYLGGLGTSLIVRRFGGGWVTVGNQQLLPDQTVLVTGTSHVFVSGWVGTKYVRSTAAGATTVTVPQAALTPIGCRLQYICEGAGGGTLSADVNIRAGGSAAGTLAAAINVPTTIEFNGATWVAT